MQADFHYINNGLFTKFIPLTDAAEAIWREFVELNKCDDFVVPYTQVKSFINQMRAAGYSVKKSPPVTNKEIDNILNELFN